MLCNHKDGLHPLTFRKGKIIKRAIYDKLWNLTGQEAEYKYQSLSNFKCSLCLNAYREVKLHNFVTVNAVAVAYDSLKRSENIEAAGYYIAETFVTNFLKAAKAIFDDVLQSSELTIIKCHEVLSSLQPTQSIICTHNKFATKVAQHRRRIISSEMWNNIKILLPDAIGIESTQQPCPICLESEGKMKCDLDEWAARTLQHDTCSQVFNRIADNRSISACRDLSHYTGQIYLVNTATISEWKNLAEKPCTRINSAAVTTAAPNPMICCHQKLRLPTKLAEDFFEKEEIGQWRYDDDFNCKITYECITEEEWQSMEASIRQANDIITPRHIDLKSNNYAKLTIPSRVTDPELCTTCANDRLITLNFGILQNGEKVPAPYSKTPSRKSVICKKRSTLKVSRSLKLAGLRLKMKTECGFDLWNQKLTLQKIENITFTDTDNDRSLQDLNIDDQDNIFVQYLKKGNEPKKVLEALEADLANTLRECADGNHVRRGFPSTKEASVKSTAVTAAGGTTKSGYVKLRIVRKAASEESNECDELEVASGKSLGELKLLIFHHFKYSYQFSTQQLFSDSSFKNELCHDQNLKSLSDLGIGSNSTIYIRHQTGSASSMSIIFGRDNDIHGVAL